MEVSERQRKILDALVGEYVYTAEPVGSNTLVKRYHLGVSAATVRSELSALEEGGYVLSPHVSAGRIPTDAGYRTFVDGLKAKREQVDSLERQARAAFEPIRWATEFDEFISGVTAALTKLTSCLAIIAAPTIAKAQPRRISIVPVTAASCVVVVVMQDGTVANRRVSLPVEVDPADLADLESRLNEVLGGREAGKVRQLAEQDPDRLAALLGSTPLARRIIAEVGACLSSQQPEAPYRSGLSSLLEEPEFTDPATAVPLTRLLEDGHGLARLLDGVAEVEGVVVRIGHENGDGLPPMSVVASGYSALDADGLVAVVGPTRMDYAKAIAAIRAAAVTLEATLR